MNTMAQPSGSVCGIRNRYRTYLRSSPVICAADCISILVQIAVIPVHLQTSPRIALDVLLHRRFDQYYEEEESEIAIQDLEKLTWFRWVFFVFGTFPPVLKLTAMENVLWSKIWGMIFLASFLFVEALALLPEPSRLQYTRS